MREWLCSTLYLKQMLYKASFPNVYHTKLERFVLSVVCSTLTYINATAEEMYAPASLENLDTC